MRSVIILIALTVCGESNKVIAQNYCDYPYAFTLPSQPESIDTFVVNVDTVNNFYGAEFEVKLKFAIPKKDKLPFVKRPLIIAVHGGGFVSDSLGNNASTNAYLSFFNQMYKTFAPLGFNTASLDYRTGFGKEEELALSYAVSQPGSAYCQWMTPHVQKRLKEAAIRATADCRKAIDYIVTHPNQFPYIDTDQIYLYGGSAGAMTVLHTAFTDYAEIFPQGNPDFKPFAPRHKIAGVISAAGAMTDIDGDALAQIKKGENIPTFLAHGSADEVVLHNTGPIANCTDVDAEHYWHGSSTLADEFCKKEIPYELFFIEQAGHNLGGGYPVGGALGAHMVGFMINHGICPKNTPSVNYTFDLQGNEKQKVECQLNTTINHLKTPVNIYPNPVQQTLYIDGENLGEIQTISVHNTLGQTVFQTDKPTSSINLQSLTSGVYFITLTSEREESVLKIIKH